MAVVTLLGLKDERTLAFQGCASMHILWGNRLTAPRMHDRTPGCVLTQMRHSAESDRDQENCEHGNRSAPPALLTFSGDEWKRQKHDDSNRRTDQQYRCLRGRGQEREQRVEPKKEEVGARGSLNNRRI